MGPGFLWGAGNARKSDVQPSQVELNKEHYAWGTVETGQELQGEVGARVGRSHAAPHQLDLGPVTDKEQAALHVRRTAACTSRVAEGR